MMRASDVLDQDSVIFAALPLFHTNALLVTVLAPLLKGQHVVWGGPLGYRDAPLFPNFWKIVERYRISSMSGVPTIYAVLVADTSRRRHLEPEGAGRRCRTATNRGAPCLRGAYRSLAVRGLRAHRGHLCQRAQLARG